MFTTAYVCAGFYLNLYLKLVDEVKKLTEYVVIYGILPNLG